MSEEENINTIQKGNENKKDSEMECEVPNKEKSETQNNNNEIKNNGGGINDQGENVNSDQKGNVMEEKYALNSLEAELVEMGFEISAIKEALLITQDKDKAIEYIISLLESQDKNVEDNDEDFEDEEDEDYKIIFLVRMDLKMGLGKMAAQVGHATLKAYKQMEARAEHNEIDEVNFFEWLEGGQKKIVVKVNTEAELLETLEKAKQKGLNSCYIRDAGLTQIASGSLTVGAIGPAPSSEIDPLTKQFKLL